MGRAWGVHQSPGPVSHSVPDFLPGEGRAGGRVTARPGPSSLAHTHLPAPESTVALWPARAVLGADGMWVPATWVGKRAPSP